MAIPAVSNLLADTSSQVNLKCFSIYHAKTGRIFQQYVTITPRRRGGIWLIPTAGFEPTALTHEVRIWRDWHCNHSLQLAPWLFELISAIYMNQSSRRAYATDMINHVVLKRASGKTLQHSFAGWFHSLSECASFTRTPTLSFRLPSEV